LTGSEIIHVGDRPGTLTHGIAPDGFAIIYQQYHAVLVSYALLRTRDLSMAEDIAAQTFLLAWQALDRYEDRGVPISAWLFRIATNLITDQARRAQRLEVCHADEEIEHRADHTDQFAHWEQAAWISDHLVHLTPSQRRAVELRFWEDRSLLEIATALDRSVGATKALLSRSLHTMRARMDQDLAATA
jgi:RNA polymerase sigma-70 factor (ECF subfamily)